MPRLKSLELHGYKTFANRTLFEFPGEVTAIVGPNGSGKSNIADAIRWVLGEQSYSLLRGRKTEDMIFSGSEQRPRAGMASATITFDNSDGWLPIDYSEVSITRRAYRDGQNEYLLNGQRVRLREISELLANSGLAERTYTIIGQGLVDAALALKPEERRRLFEEAAGIGLYRTRREEALNRLELTRRNLERVQDILAELEPRIQSLQRQARRAQEYERIREELRGLLREWYGYHWHKKQEDLARAREVARVQDDRLQRARQKRQELLDQLAATRGRIQEKRSRLGQWHTELSALHKERERISRSLAILEERRRGLEDQKSSIAADRGRLEEEIQAGRGRLQAAEAEIERLKQDLEEARSQAKLAREAFNERQAERKQVEVDVSVIREELIAYETRQVMARAQQKETASRLENLRLSLERAHQILNKNQEEVDKARRNLQLAEGVRDQAVEQARLANEALAAHQTNIASLELQRQKLLSEQTDVEAERARIQFQIEALEQAERSLSGYAEGARMLIQAAEQGRLTGVGRLLRGLIEVPEEYEAAIGAALGEYVDAVLLENSASIHTALELLESSAKGRAAILPVDELRRFRNPIPRTVNGLIGLASELVVVEDSIKPIVEVLLGDAAVVHDRLDAQRIVLELKPPYRVVTLKGEIFYPNGAVLGGPPLQPGVLSRPRERKTLKARSASLDSRLEEITGELTRLTKAMDEALARGADLERNLREKMELAEEAHQKYRSAVLFEEQARRQTDWQTQQIAELEKQINTAEESITAAEKELIELENLLASSNQRLRERQEVLFQLPLDEDQTQATHWETSVSYAARAVNEAEKRLDERRFSLAAQERQLDVIRQRLKEIDSGLEEAEKERDDLREQESAILDKIAELSKLIEPAEEEVRSAEVEYEQLQAAEANAQQGLTAIERQASQAQLEFARARDALDSLRQRIEEDFGLVAFEYAAEIDGPTPLPLDGMVEQLPQIKKLNPEVEEGIARLRAQMRRMGAINPEAQAEYQSVLERYEFMTSQVADLHKADADLRRVIAELDDLMRKEFRRTFVAVAEEFKSMFTRLFAGGNAHLILTDEENPAETGIEIEARLPGRREQGLSLLSGGERSLTAVALVFALLKVSPTPFCVMDEVDAMLDESNVGRFRELLSDLSRTTQFIVITHNRNTVQAAGVIYGVTMGRDSSSQVISLRLDDISEELVGGQN